MVYIKVYDRYINKPIDQFKLNINAEKLSVGDRIICNKKNGTSVVTEEYRVKSIRHEIAFEGEYEEDVATYKKTIIEVN